MKAVDLTKTLQDFKSGWVALNKDHEVIKTASTFKKIATEVENDKRLNQSEIILLPASDDYFGFIT